MDKLTNPNDYIKELQKRKVKSRIYQKYQLTGLMISDLLKDKKHKTLYIKLAKEINNNRLLELAKSIAENEKIKNPAAYFMWKIKYDGLLKKINKKNSRSKKIVTQTLFKKNKKCIKI